MVRSKLSSLVSSVWCVRMDRSKLFSSIINTSGSCNRVLDTDYLLDREAAVNFAGFSCSCCRARNKNRTGFLMYFGFENIKVKCWSTKQFSRSRNENVTPGVGCVPVLP
jgi:hypothetical protein